MEAVLLVVGVVVFGRKPRFEQCHRAAHPEVDAVHVLGMNVAGLPGTEDPGSFLIASVIMVVLGILLVIIFKMKKWI